MFALRIVLNCPAVFRGTIAQTGYQLVPVLGRALSRQLEEF